MAESFKNGDRVVVVRDYHEGHVAGKKGTVVVDDDFNSLGIRFDENVGGHDCSGKCETLYGWFISGNALTKLPKFEVGDKVKCIAGFDGRIIDKTGTIVGINGTADAAIEFDEFINGHACGGRAKTGYGYNVPFNYMQKIDVVTTSIVKQSSYEVGDIVKIREDLITGNIYKHNTGESNSVVIDMQDYAGKHMKIASLGNYGYRLRNDESDCNWTDDMIEGKVIDKKIPAGIKLVDKAEPEKFKIGDKVVVHSKTVGSSSSSHRDNARTHGQPYLYVAGYYRDHYICNENNVKRDAGDYFRHTDLTLYTEEPKVELREEPKVVPNKFKVGDIVRGNSSARYSYTNDKMTKGRVVEVISQTEIRVEILERTDNNMLGNRHRVDSEFFELVTDTIKLTEKKDGAKPMPVGKYKVGDKVRLTSTKPLYGHGEVKTGDVGTITGIYDVNGRGGYVAYTIDFSAQTGWHGAECDLALSQFASPMPKAGISLTERKAVAPGITSKVVMSSDGYEYDEEEEYDYEDEEEYEEDYEEDYIEGCDCDECRAIRGEMPYASPCAEILFPVADYVPCNLGISLTPSVPGILRRDIMQPGIKLTEMTPYGEMPARGMYPINKKEGQGGIMNAFGKLFGGNVGKDNSGRLALTVAGIAIKNNEGKFVAYKDGALIDVMDAKFDIDNAFYRIPTLEVKKDDIIINQSGVPVIVIKSTKEGLDVINPYNGLKETIVPSTNLMNIKFYVKVVSLFGDMFKDIDLKNPTSFMPFMLMGEGSDMGEMLPLMMMMNGGKGTDMNAMLPLLMLSGKGGDKSDMLLPMMLMGQGGKGLDNSMLPLLMMSGKGGDKSDMLLPLMMMGQGGKGADMNAMLPLLLMGKGGKGGDMMETMLLMNAMGGKGFGFGAPAAAETTTEA